MADSEQRVHGDIDHAELARLGIEPAELLDLSVNVSPLGPHPEVVAAARSAALDRYPDRRSAHAKRAIASALDVDEARVMLGHGAAELLWTLVQSFADAQRPLLSIGPTFSEPEAAARTHGIPCVQLRMPEASDFALDAAAIDAAIRLHAPCAVYLCHPNNPTGRALALPALQALCEAHPTTHFILDQAFLSLSTRHGEHSARFGEHVVLVRSLTKDHALPGLRVAYALAQPELAARVEARRAAWMISAPAQAAIVAAMARPEHVDQARQALLAGRAGLAAALAPRGVHVVPSETHFLLARVGAADAFRDRLLRRHRILVRSCTSFGLPDHVRLAGCAPTDLARLLAAWDAA
ncbi:MAG TPA: aminotransferase class I/II-fold pyridoxal phosphate-dependent enzyme [Polyangiales bacterium]